MKFDKNKTCVDFFEKGILCDIYIDNDWPLPRKFAFTHELRNSFDACSPLFSQRIQYITQPFYQAFAKARPKIIDILKENPLGDASGTFIINQGDGVVKTVFYSIQNNKKDEFSSIYMEFTRSKHDNVTGCGAAIQQLKDGRMNTYIGDGYKKYTVDAHLILAEFILMATFLKYCDIETKIITPNEQYKDKKNTKFFNQTKSNIEILDTTWFTNIVSSKGFEVSGHLRLQPYGPGMSMLKWIYIESFQKEGYNIKAKKHE